MNRRIVLTGVGTMLSSLIGGCFGHPNTRPHGGEYPEHLRIQNRADEPLNVSITVSNTKTDELLESETYQVQPDGETVKVEFEFSEGTYEYTVSIDGGAEKSTTYSPSESSYLRVSIQNRELLEITEDLE